MIHRVFTSIMMAIVLGAISPAAFGQDDGQRRGRRQKEPVEVIHREKQNPDRSAGESENEGSKERNERPERSRERERRPRP